MVDGLELAGGAEPLAVGGSEHVRGSDIGGDGPFGGRDYLVGAYVVAPRPLGPLADELHEVLSGMPDVLGSASAPAPGLCAVRVLAESAPALYAALGRVRAAARAALDLGPTPREVS